MSPLTRKAYKRRSSIRWRRLMEPHRPRRLSRAINRWRRKHGQSLERA